MHRILAEMAKTRDKLNFKEGCGVSRSYKKHPYCTDGRSPTTRKMRSIANRSVRRRNKRIVNAWWLEDSRFENYLTLDGKSYKKWFCSYNIHDYISRWSKTEALHDYYSGAIKWWSWDNYTEKQFLNYWAKYYRRK